MKVTEIGPFMLKASSLKAPTIQANYNDKMSEVIIRVQYKVTEIGLFMLKSSS